MFKFKPGFRALLATAVLVAALAIPAQAAVAQQTNCSSGDPTASQYCDVSGVNTGSSGNGPTTEAAQTEGATPTVTPVAATTVESSGSTLPFTGLDVGILVLVAAGLGAAGFVLRRLTASGVPRA